MEPYGCWVESAGTDRCVRLMGYVDDYNPQHSIHVSKSTKFGKKFERDFQDILEELSGRFKLSYLRLYDTTAARGAYLPESPGDFIIAAAGRGHLVELKSSEEYESLRSCLSDHMSTRQAAGLRLWQRAGCPSWVFFYSLTAGKVELWHGDVAGTCRAKGLRLPKEGDKDGPLVLSRDTLKDLMFNTFLKEWQ